MLCRLFKKEISVCRLKHYLNLSDGPKRNKNLFVFAKVAPRPERAEGATPAESLSDKSDLKFRVFMWKNNDLILKNELVFARTAPTARSCIHSGET